MGGGKTTLLEVQAIAENEATITYKWKKDNNPLEDDGQHFIGSDKPILCIVKALLTSAGTYTCDVKLHEKLGGSIVVISDPVILVVNPDPSTKAVIDTYRARTEVPADSWPSVRCEKYTDIVLAVDRTCPLKANDVQMRESSCYAEAFGKYRKGVLVLVEGHPGCGKTTLANKVTKDWARGMCILEGAKLVVYVSLKELPRLPNLSDALKQLHLTEEDMMKLTPMQSLALLSAVSHV